MLQFTIIISCFNKARTLFNPENVSSQAEYGNGCSDAISKCNRMLSDHYLTRCNMYIFVALFIPGPGVAQKILMSLEGSSSLHVMFVSRKVPNQVSPPPYLFFLCPTVDIG